MVIRSTFPTTVVTVKVSVVAASRADVGISSMSSASNRVFLISIPIGRGGFRASICAFSRSTTGYYTVKGLMSIHAMY